MRRNGYEPGDSPEYLFATNNPLRLFYIDESGNMLTYKEFCKSREKEPGELEVLAIGSGSDHMERYIETQIEDDEEGIYLKRFSISGAPSAIVEILHKPIKKDVDSSAPVVIAGITERQVFYDQNRFAKAAAKAEAEEAEDFGTEVQDSFDKKP
ncbi:MAG: hypothetical protein KJ600_03320 [Nanoarchaeota archaeon]|nr:hypothetical protein [Nanoarchaeota archaeon]